MKPFTKFALVTLAAAGGWGFYQDTFHADESQMESLHRRVDVHQVECTKTDNLAGHAWLACRWGDNGDWGSLWVEWDDGSGPAWVTQNGKAVRIVEKVGELPSDMQPKNIRIRRNTPEDSMTPEYASLPSVPWDQLD